MHFGPGVTIDLWWKFGVPSGIVAWILDSIAEAEAAHGDNIGASAMGVSEYNQYYNYLNNYSSSYRTFHRRN